MQNYYIEISPDVDNDIIELTDYIYRMSFSENIAWNLYNELYAKIYSLSFMPEMYQKVLWEYRVALVKKTYRIFYRVEEENKKVIIVRIIRTDQNIEDILFD
jgi:plasmid stabilization system protein ParE